MKKLCRISASLLLIFVLLFTSACGLLSGEKVYTPCSSAECVNKDWIWVETELLAAGFTNISEELIEDLDYTDADQYGKVVSVSINGVSEFEGNTEFGSLSKVVVKYHSYKRVSVPISYDEAKNVESNILVQSFRDAGFINVSASEVCDLDPDITNVAFETIVTIGGEEFDKDSMYPLDAEVEIVTHKPYNKYNLKVIVDFTANWIFSTYDVFIDVNGHKNKMEHGEDGVFEYRLKEGEYIITFHKDETAEVNGTAHINLVGDTEASYKIKCHSDEIAVEINYVNTEKPVGENEAKTPLSAVECKNKNFVDVENAFINAGFSNVNTSILYDIVWGGTEEGAVEEVFISGNDDFKKGDVYNKTAEIIITYHMKAENEPIVTIENNDVFSKLMEVSDIYDSETIQRYVDELKGKKIVFDGCVVLITYHENSSTRYDVCLAGWKYDAAEMFGPIFYFENVVYSDLNVIGGAEITMTANYKITARVIGFDAESGCVKLAPLAMEEEYDPNKPVFYSSNNLENAKKGNKGVFSYKSDGAQYDIYWIIDFDAGYVYNFTEGAGDTTCDKVKIVSGTLNDKVKITWHDGGTQWSYYLYFEYSKQPETLIMKDNNGFTWEYEATNLKNAKSLLSTKKIIER